MNRAATWRAKLGWCCDTWRIGEDGSSAASGSAHAPRRTHARAHHARRFDGAAAGARAVQMAPDADHFVQTRRDEVAIDLEDRGCARPKHPRSGRYVSARIAVCPRLPAPNRIASSLTPPRRLVAALRRELPRAHRRKAISAHCAPSPPPSLMRRSACRRRRHRAARASSVPPASACHHPQPSPRLREPESPSVHILYYSLAPPAPVRSHPRAIIACPQRQARLGLRPRPRPSVRLQIGAPP